MHRLFTSTIVALELACALSLSFCGPPAYARFAPTPLPFSCDTIRAAVKAMTPAQLKAAAETFNIHVTAAQTREARKCLTK